MKGKQDDFFVVVRDKKKKEEYMYEWKDDDLKETIHINHIQNCA